MRIFLSILILVFSIQSLAKGDDIQNFQIDSMNASDLIEELVEYQYQLNKVPSLNEQIGLNHFFYKMKGLFN